MSRGLEPGRLEPEVVMLNLVYAAAAGLLVFAALALPGLLSPLEAIAPGFLTLLVAYFVLARRSFKQVEGIFTEASKALTAMPPKLELAVQTLEKAYPLGKVQIGITSQVDTQIGMLYFLQQDFNKALPYLQRSMAFGHWIGAAMLGVIHYKKKDHAAMRRTFETVLKKAKNQGLAFNLYAYLLQQIGDNDGAQKVLVDGVKRTKDDPKVKDSLLAVQNGKKIKMKAYKEQWYQFHLERPPMDQQPAFMQGKMGKIARRGRW